MRTILLNVEYDGTAYAGWQVQSNALTVQEVVESALTQILGYEIRIHSSSRTDAGVHARDMAVHFRTESTIPLTAFCAGANAFLPDDVVIRQAREMPETFTPAFHPRANGIVIRFTTPMCARPFLVEQPGIYAAPGFGTDARGRSSSRR